MTAPINACNNPGRGRWYRHPVSGEEWPSVTNILGVSVAKPALVSAATKITAEKAWQMLPQMVAAARKPSQQEDLTREIKAEASARWGSAADLGTRIHKRIESRVLGSPFGDDQEIEPFVDQAFQFFADFGIEPATDIEASEATVVNRTVGYAGTGDLWVWLRHDDRRELWLIDFKSSTTRPATSVFPEMGMQVAALAHGEVLLLDDGTEIEPPGPVTKAGILNLRGDRYALMPMPLAGTLDDAYAAFCGARTNAVYLHSTYGAKPKPLTPPALKVVA